MGNVAKKGRYLPLDGYDPSTPLAKPEAELYCLEIIANGGNKKRAFEKVYNNGMPLPVSKQSYPYTYFRGKKIRARYQYLVNEFIDHAGIDAQSLLVKSARLIEAAAHRGDVDDFTKMVNVIMKIKGEDVKKVMTVSKQLKVTEDDKAAIDALFEEL